MGIVDSGYSAYSEGPELIESVDGDIFEFVVLRIAVLLQQELLLVKSVE